MSRLDELYQTPDEIANAILSAVKEFEVIRIASINCKCYNETMFFQVLEYLKEQELVDYNDNFIYEFNK